MADNTAALELPVGITENKLLQQLARLESAMRGAANNSAQTWVKANKKVVDSFTDINKATKGLSDSNKAALTNVGFQVQDLIVQIQGGTSVTRALAQQLPQLLSGFGLVGVAAGTLAPLIISVATSFLGAKTNGEEFEKQVKSLTSVLDAYRKANDAASQNMGDLEQKFGSNAVQARQLYTALAALAKLKFADQSTKLRTSLTDSLAPVKDLIDQYNAAMKGGVDGQTARDILVMGESARTLADNFGLTVDQAQAVATAMDHLTSATSAGDWAAAAAELTQALSVARDEAGKIPEPIGTAADSAGKLAEVAFSAASALGKTATVATTLAQTDVSPGIQAGVTAADDLLGKMQAALTYAQSLGGYSPDLSRFAEISPFVGETENAPTSSPRPQEAPHGLAWVDWGVDTKKPKAPKQSASEKAVQRYDDSTLKDIAGMKAETEQYAALSGSYDAYGLSIQRAAKEAELLQVLQNKGVTITPQLREQVKGLADDWYKTAEANAEAKAKYEEFQQSFSDAKSTLSDAFTGLVTGAESFGDALSNILLKLAEMAASKAFEGLWSSSSGNDWLASGLKALGFASGGYTGAGGKNDPAGIVHKGEVVWSQRDIAKAGGVGVVEAMRRNGGAIPGYALGGVVDMPSIALPAQLRTGGQSTGAQPVQTSVAVEPSPYFDVRVSQISGGVTQRGLRANSKTLGRQNQNFQLRGTT
ncbi:hypothetical protein [Paenirhodobacter enshiensis]|uniref:hypothetical protein n=1 Tax=Paenirhodobacter enshiensis TaxID=1105367 RepID=UPI0035B42AC4